MAEPKIRENRWDKELEKEFYEVWKKSGAFAFDQKSKGPVFSIDTPPPYVNTPIHIGQATTYVMMDMFARFRRMRGYNVLFPLGLDRNGLPIEMAAEKRFNTKLTSLPRDEAIKLCEQILEESSMASMESFLRLGIGFNSWKKGSGLGEVYETDSPDYRSLTQETFIDLWKKGLIYEDTRVNNFCPGCQTTLADAEIEYENRSGIYYHIKFRIKGSSEEIIIATTRPELVCTIGAVIFNPKDERYIHLEGKVAVAPVFEREVPIMAHPSAEMEKGTGIMMVCSFGDLADIRFFREHGLEPRIAINKDGTMNEEAFFLEGLTVEQARKRYVQELEDRGLIVKKVPTNEHRTPICERSKDAIEFIGMPEFYVRQVEFRGDMKKLAKKLNFFAPASRQILLDWIESVSMDWPISRRRYYATEVPLWYCKKCGHIIVPPKGGYYKPWKEPPPSGSEGMKGHECAKCGSREFRGEERVFDTWFDSSISPLYIMKYSRQPHGFFEKHKPCTLRPQGKEIIRTWLYYTLLKDWLLTGECIFRDVWINYHITDEKGNKMSKSKGNVIDPRDILDKFGAEPFRLWAAIEGNLEKTDFKCSFERIEGASKTITKLLNVARFISMFPEAEKRPKKPCAADEWIMGELAEIVKAATESYENYDFHNPSIKIKNFIWEAFSSHYVELVKNRAYNQEGKFTKNQQDSALWTLNYVLDTILKIWAPVLPFITAKIYRDMRGKDIHAAEFPAPSKAKKGEFTTVELLALDAAVWKAKKDKGLSLKSDLCSLTVPEKFRPLEKDLISAHKIKRLDYGKEVRAEA
jgi:valyl-tRNA synthetase